MEYRKVTEGFTKPTAKIYLTALMLEIYFLYFYERSPAYFDISELASHFGTELVFVILIFHAVVLFLLLPILLLVLAISAPVYYFVRHFFLKCRPFRAFIYLFHRDYVDTKIVENYLEIQHNELLSSRVKEAKMNERNALSILQVQCGIFVCLLTVVLVSGPDNPNFFMKVCVGSEVQTSCGLYKAVICGAIMQATILLALSYQNLRHSEKTNTKNVELDSAILEQAKATGLQKGLFLRSRKWSRGKTESIAGSKPTPPP